MKWFSKKHWSLTASSPSERETPSHRLFAEANIKKNPNIIDMSFYLLPVASHLFPRASPPQHCLIDTLGNIQLYGTQPCSSCSGPRHYSVAQDCEGRYHQTRRVTAPRKQPRLLTWFIASDISNCNVPNLFNDCAATYHNSSEFHMNLRCCCILNGLAAFTGSHMVMWCNAYWPYTPTAAPGHVVQALWIAMLHCLRVTI